jgi:hypothetical protein
VWLLGVKGLLIASFISILAKILITNIFMELKNPLSIWAFIYTALFECFIFSLYLLCMTIIFVKPPFYSKIELISIILSYIFLSWFPNLILVKKDNDKRIIKSLLLGIWFPIILFILIILEYAT